METEKIKLSELLAMDMGQLSDWMISKKGSYDTVTLSPQTAEVSPSKSSDLLCGKVNNCVYHLTEALEVAGDRHPSYDHILVVRDTVKNLLKAVKEAI